MEIYTKCDGLDSHSNYVEFHVKFTCRFDSLSFLFDDKESGKSGVENIILKFVKPANTHIAKLLIRAKNSFWLDGLFLKFHSLFGKNFDEFARRQETAPGDKLREWSLNQKLPLSVYVEENGKWNFTDYFNIAGPMAYRGHQPDSSWSPRPTEP